MAYELTGVGSITLSDFVTVPAVTASSYVSVPAGAEATPSLRVGEATSGLYRPTTGATAVVSLGVEKVRFWGNVSIFGGVTNFGLGTSTQPRVQLQGTSGSGTMLALQRWSADNNGARVAAYKSRGTTVGVNGGGALTSAGYIVEYLAYGDNGGSTPILGGGAYFQTSQQWTSTNAGTEFKIDLNPDDSLVNETALRVSLNSGLTYKTYVVVSAAGHHRLRSYTISALPAATAGEIVYCSDLGGGGGEVCYDGSRWRRTSGGQQTVNTNSDFTLTVLASAEEQKHIGTLTADRTITLSTMNAYVGARFKVVRVGTDAFNLSLGGLKNLAANTLAEVTFDGSAWYLSDYQRLSADTVFRAEDHGIRTNGTAAANSAAIALLVSSLPALGGKILFGPGAYNFDATIEIDAKPGVVLQGAGLDATVLDFDATTGTEDGVKFQDQSWFGGVRDLTIANAARHGLVVEDEDGSNPFSMIFDNVGIRGNGGNGFQSTDGFMLALRNVRSWNNGGDGFALLGFHTTVNASTCWAVSNAGDGWDINDVVYSKFAACGADSNGDAATGVGAGWRISNVHSASWDGCEAESNQEAGFLIETDDGSTSLMDGSVSIKLSNCFGLNNDRAADNTGFRAGAYTANFLYVDGYPVGSGTGSRDIDIVLDRCEDRNYNADRSGTTTYAGPSVLADGYYRILEDNCRWALTGDGAGVDANQFGSYRVRGSYFSSNGDGISVTDGTAKNIASLRKSNGRSQEFGGLVQVTVAPTRASEFASKSATYLLFVNKNTATLVSSVGDTSGAAASDPSFTFAVASNKLTMTRVGTTVSSTFFYSVQSLSDDLIVLAP